MPLWIVPAREFVLETAIIILRVLRALQQQLKFMVGQSSYNAAVGIQSACRCNTINHLFRAIRMELTTKNGALCLCKSCYG